MLRIETKAHRAQRWVAIPPPPSRCYARASSIGAATFSASSFEKHVATHSAHIACHKTSPPHTREVRQPPRTPDVLAKWFRWPTSFAPCASRDQTSFASSVVAGANALKQSVISVFGRCDLAQQHAWRSCPLSRLIITPYSTTVPAQIIKQRPCKITMQLCKHGGGAALRSWALPLRLQIKPSPECDGAAPP